MVVVVVEKGVGVCRRFEWVGWSNLGQLISHAALADGQKSAVPMRQS
jgi:hypothetical protein